MEHEEALRPRTARRVAVALAALLTLSLAGVWSQRKPIARDFVDRALRARGVPARYVIAELAPGRQRLTDVMIGDPANPDLTAREVELQVGYGLGWPSIRAVKAHGVRLRGRVVDGTLSLGSIDRLLPAGRGKPFSLPDLRVYLADTALRLDTPAGAVAVAVAGTGNLAGGFVGRATATAARLMAGGCTIEAPLARLAIRVTDRRPRVTGPMQAERGACAGVTVARPRLTVDALLADSLTPLTARAGLAGGRAAAGARRAAGVRGQMAYDARDPRDRHGTLALTLDGVTAGAGSAASLVLSGDYRIGNAVPVRGGSLRPLRLAGTVKALGVAIVPARLRAVRAIGNHGAGTPVAPLATALGSAAANAARHFGGNATFAFDGDVRDGGTLTGEAALTSLEATSRSGARLRAGGTARLIVGRGTVRVDGTADLAGGGFPATRLRVRQGAGTALSGEATIAPFASGGARLALAPVRVSRDAGGTLRFATVATIDGPLGDGRVTGLALPIEATARNGLIVNPECVPLRFATLAIAGVRLGATRLPLCPVGGAMVRVRGGQASGGMMVPRPRLTGQVGRQPLTITANALRVDIGRPGFVADALAVRLGGGGDPTRLDVARLEGRVAAGGVGGRFAGAAGAIANVPLLLSGGAGDWRLAGGRLALTAGLTVADAAAQPRFNPLVARDVTLDLVGGAIRAGGTLREPKSGLGVSEVSLRHDLATGRGQAVLDVGGITFGPAFQPEALTRLTLGVVANVAGTMRGQGRIAWGPEGATSTGDFATDNIDLAAVFGPVTGIVGKIHFSDLLGLVTPPGQLVTVAAFNPGIAVEGGVIGYQLLPGQKVAVGGGKWPFFGGALILEPTVLDFGQPVERRMTFRVEGMDAAMFIAQFEFRNIAATGRFDGSLPMIFDQTGGRIAGGRLAVRPPGGTLAYVGELTNKELGTFGKLAFDALKAIRYDNLAIELDGALDSEIVSRITFTGTNENPAPEKRAKGLLKNLTGLPFKFNIVIRAPFRGLTSSASAFVNPGGLIRGAAIPPAADAPAVQPPLSGNKR